MQMWIGYLLILVGLAMIIAGALAWAGVIKVQYMADGGIWSFLTELLRKAPWVVVVGIILIYVGCKMIGVNLPP
jgi:hypothetical protein